MTAIALVGPDTATTTSPDLTARLRPLLRRLAAWRRHRGYPATRRARREAVFAWSADVVRHSAIGH